MQDLTSLEVELTLAFLCQQLVDLNVTIGGGREGEATQRRSRRRRQDDLKREGEAGEATISGAQDFVTGEKMKEREREGLCVKRAGEGEGTLEAESRVGGVNRPEPLLFSGEAVAFYYLICHCLIPLVVKIS
jgi:hypothetical protein